jgi:hypothetical protein
MKTFVVLFIVAALFGLAVDVVYWFVAHVEPAGIALLSVMTIGLVFAALYATFAERDANLEGDDPNSTAASVAGEEIEIFTTHTPWPVWCAASTLALLCGVVWSPMVAGLGLLALLYGIYRLGRESSVT